MTTTRFCPACKGYGRVAPPEDPQAPASAYVLCRKCGGAGRQPKKTPDYAASFAHLADGRTALICASEADARPWVNLLARAGLTLAHLERAGGYTFRLADVPALLSTETEAERQPYHWLDDPDPAPQETPAPAGQSGDPVRAVMTQTLASIAVLCGFCFSPTARDVRAAKLASEALELAGIMDPAAWLREHAAG